MTRKEHWATRDYHDFILSRAHTPFAYGNNDCCTFAADGILAMTGVDIAADFRGYATEQGALLAIKRVTGGSTVEDAAVWCAEKYELAEWHAPLFAQRGDLVLLSDSGSLLMGLVHLNGREVLSPGEKELRRLPITEIKRAWRVG